MSEAEHRAQLRRALIASTVGTAIAWTLRLRGTDRPGVLADQLNGRDIEVTIHALGHDHAVWAVADCR
jgi:hypothetical protein